MEIKVFGTGCANCKKLLAATQKAVAEKGSDAQVIYVTDMKDIMAAGIMRTPALTVDGKAVVSGRVPSVEEIKKLI